MNEYAKKYAGYRGAILRFLIISGFSVLAVPFVDSALRNWPTHQQMLTGYAIGMVYAICVGGILNPLSPIVWERTCRMKPASRWALRALLIMAGTTIGCLIAGIPVRVVLGPTYNYWVSYWLSLQISLVLAVLVYASITVYSSIKSKLEVSRLQLKEKEVEREKALKLATEATLSSLESRLHPHFLFNTINSISSLIQEDPARAEKMLSQMADLLRFSLDSSRGGLVPLSREMKIVRDYLEIEKARFEGRLRYDIRIPAELDDLPFPPLSLQTLVENSIKYAVSVTRSGADIAIHARREGGRVNISVEDNGPGFDSLDLPAGHGLSSLRERLQSLYQGAADLQISSRSGATVIGLTIPDARLSS